MNCPKCKNDMQWLRIKLFQNRNHYCTKCGYSERKRLFRKPLENVIYAIGFLSNQKAVTLFITKKSYEDYKKFIESVDNFTFHPLYNSKNLK